MLGIGVGVGVALLIGAAGAGAQVATKPSGHWEGSGDIANNWTKARPLRVALDIAADGSVTGTVGDAKFHGTLAANRGALGRALTMKTDWIVRGDLGATRRE